MNNTEEKMIDITSHIIENKCEVFLLIGNSDNADVYYSTDFMASDPFTYIHTKDNKEILIVSSMEEGRARLESRVSDIRTLQEYGFLEKIKERKDHEAAFCECLAEIFKNENVKHIMVPHDFPLYKAQLLKEMGFSVIAANDPFKKLRSIKSKREIELIRASQKGCEEAMAKAIRMIAESDNRGGILYSGDRPLTSSDIRIAIEHTLLDNGCEADSTIVACGKGAANPHWEGEGEILADEAVVIDIFPRHKKNRYYADMTRTVAKGDPCKELKDMYEAVLAAQEAAFAALRPGVLYSDVHAAVCEEFEKRGYDTIRNSSKEGFIHSTGHGVGLEIHESPGVGMQEIVAQPGHVVTVEPGLYYPNIGGIRIEDMVVITQDGFENLTTMEKKFVV